MADDDQSYDPSGEADDEAGGGSADADGRADADDTKGPAAYYRRLLSLAGLEDDGAFDLTDGYGNTVTGDPNDPNNPVAVTAPHGHWWEPIYGDPSIFPAATSPDAPAAPLPSWQDIWKSIANAYATGQQLQGEGLMQQAREGQGSGWNNPVIDAAGKTWNMPNTLVGGMIGLGAMGLGNLAGTSPYIQSGDNAIQFMNSPVDIDGRAFTLGNVQIYPASKGPDVRYRSGYTGLNVRNGDHEAYHTYQGQLLGPLFGPLEIAGATLMGDSNPLEAAADRYAAAKSRSPQ